MIRFLRSLASAVDRAHRRRYTELVTYAAYSVDQLELPPFVDLLAQIIHVHVNHVGHGVRRQLPDKLDDHVAGDATPGVPHEILEEAELLGRQLNRLARAPDRSLHAIQLQIFDLQDRLNRPDFAAHDRANPRQELG